MSIIIKGMDMPIECGNCDFFREDYGVPYCFITEKHIYFIGEIADFCPLIEIPTPHGRLIDEDSVLDQVENAYQIYKFNSAYYHQIKDYLVNAPTILEAEREPITFYDKPIGDAKEMPTTTSAHTILEAEE